MQAEKLRLEQEAHMLSQTLSAVMNDKFEVHRTEFDADTPIDKVLNMMHGLITKVRAGLNPCKHCRQADMRVPGKQCGPALCNSSQHVYIVLHWLSACSFVCDMLLTNCN